MTVGGLPVTEAAWPLRVLVVESPGLPGGSVPGGGRDLVVQVVPDVYAALLALGADHPGAVVLPTDLVGADVAQVTASILARHDLPVLVALVEHEEVGELAGRAVAAGCSGLLPAPVTERHLRAALSRAARVERGGPGDRLMVGGLTIDLGGLTVAGEGGARVQLSDLQFRCLYLLAQAWPRLVRLEALRDDLGLTGAHGTDRTRRVVARLRHHIAPVAGTTEVIENVRGVGYRLRG